MSTPEQREVAALLVRKASSDLAAAKVLATDPDQLDDVVGFHVQQAVKSVLAAHGLAVPRTHDLTYLLELASESGIDTPVSVDAAEHMTPWAVATRYDDVISGLDRIAALQLAEVAVGRARTTTDAADG